MFSISAINDTDSKGQWEPLAPTKEAQEFHITQSYHEGLLKLQAKEYENARELLESVLKDPLVSSAQVDGSASDGHLLQLRFLALKNLATVFLEQGHRHYESALHCYLQAVEIDAKDSVVWNQLGTLSCSMGSLSISRWAFEQGLVCSPNNWNCMEKLLEVLIAIGDEVSCLSVAGLILRHWPSHSRALHVKRIIEEAVPVPFAPRGIDKLEPRHARLKFLGKRKASYEATGEGAAISKKINQNTELLLPEASWGALVDALVGVILATCGSGSEQSTEKQCKSGNIRLIIRLPGTEKLARSTERMGVTVTDTSEDTYLSGSTSDKACIPKDNEFSTFEEQPQERRSTRLERLRNRKPGKDEVDFATSKDLAKTVIECLDPFIVAGAGSKASANNGHSPHCHDNLVSSLLPECTGVSGFIAGCSKNYGAYHFSHLLLEEFARTGPVYQDYFVKLLELEKLTRHWEHARSIECSLFLAELYYDFGCRSSDVPIMSDFSKEVSYHLCKIIELVALDYPQQGGMSGNGDHLSTDGAEGNAQKVGQFGWESLFNKPLFKNRHPFWIRFFWLSGRLSSLDGNKEKAHNEFCVSLLLFTKKTDTSLPPLLLRPYCKVIRALTVDRILHEINLLEVDFLLKGTTVEMMDRGKYSECINLLAPLLFCTKDVYDDLLAIDDKEHGVSAVELLAIDVILRACELVKPMNIEVYLNCHRRRLQILMVAFGMDVCVAPHNLPQSSGLKALTAPGSELKGSTSRQFNLVAEEVKAISECALQIKDSYDPCAISNGFSSSCRSIGDIQCLLVATMYNIASIFLTKKSSGLALVGEMERKCFVDAAIGFCRLQHLNASIPVKSRVELIVAIHDLLAEYGLCCAGDGGKGEEGTFLKLAIKHLLVLDMKLKSNMISCNGGLLTNQSEEQLSENSHKTTSPAILQVTNVGFGPLEADSTSTLEVKKPVEATSLCTKENINQAVDCKRHDGRPNGKCCLENKASSQLAEKCNELTEDEREELELGIDNALDQCFFCLYGLNLRSDVSYEDDLALHRNTSRGDYQTKEQCADVFQYILPYAKASSRNGLLKMRRVLRAIRKHFPQPTEDVIVGNSIERFLDDPDLREGKLTDAVGSDAYHDCMIKILLPDPETSKLCSASLVGSSKPYLEVYGNLYYLLAQSEEINATDRRPGFVLTKEGEEFVEQNANLFKYDLIYNPLRFESWQKLGNIYDEEVDLLLNDGSKHINVAEWRKNASLPQRVELSRRRSRRCFLMSLALAKTSVQQCEMHELLALVYYDSLQNVVPFYDQRSAQPLKDSAWTMCCKNSMKHFEEAFSNKPDWTHAFYLGKLSEKLESSYNLSFSYYEKAINLNPSAVDPFYRMHASRVKLLYRRGHKDLDALKVVAAYSFDQSTKETVMDVLEGLASYLHTGANADKEKPVESHRLEEAWHLLYKDGLSALQTCVEGDLKHFHKARYMLAQGLYRRGLSGDLESARDELSFCFKSSRSSFTINMWEIDGMVKKGRRKSQGIAGNRRTREVNLPESSRKFITCIRKYILFYLKLLEESGDICTLDRAYTSLRADKRFSLCLEDLVPVAFGMYVKALISAICQPEPVGLPAACGTFEHLQEKLFTLFIEQGNLWSEICNLPEVKGLEMSESRLYGYLYRYIESLEETIRLEMLEGIVEKMRKRFKNPKLSNSNSAKVCRHASVVWCRTILISLALITPHPDLLSEGQVLDSSNGGLENSQLLCVDIEASELWNSSLDDSVHLKHLETKWGPVVSKLRNVIVKKAREENLETANSLLRCCYNFYRESSCVLLPFSVNAYLVQARLATETKLHAGMDGVETLDLSVPRKLLLWAYTLLHGRAANISVVIKHCEENAKSKMKRGSATPSAPSSASNPAVISIHTGGGKDEGEQLDATGEAIRAAAAVSQEGENSQHPNLLPSAGETHPGGTQKSLYAAPQLQQCNTATVERSTAITHVGDADKKG